jgi:succinate dehydrogenase/fumarate reductase flavoprotein subunit
VLVIGGGCAGLRAAISARQQGADVTVVTKGVIGQGSATAFLDHLIEFTVVGVSRDPQDQDLFVEDLLSFGHYVNDPHLVRLFVESTQSEFQYLQSLGIAFEPEGQMFPSHRSPRLIKGIDGFGEVLLQKLEQEALSIGVKIIENASMYHVDKPSFPHTCQVMVKGDLFKNIEIEFKSMLLATGGGGQIFSLTTNPNGSTGDGVAFALELGAEVTNLEFIHYLPLLTKPIKGYYILSPIVTKGKITNALGEPYIPRLPDGFDQMKPSVQQGYILLDMCQWIEQQILEGKVTEENAVFWDGSHLKEQILERMPNSYRRLKEHGLDLLTEKAEISIGCHQMMGGVRIDFDGRTTVPGLFAAGEVAGGFQGAERLMGTGVMEGLVFGARAGKAAAEYALHPAPAKETLQGAQPSPSAQINLTREEISQFKHQVKKQMDLILITKDEERVLQRKQKIEEIYERIKPYSALDLPLESRIAFSELKNMLLVSLAYINVSLARKESRGSFKRYDYPEKKETASPSTVSLQREASVSFKVQV